MQVVLFKNHTIRGTLDESLDELIPGSIQGRIELGRGTKELTRHGTGEAEGKFIEFVM